MKCEKCGTELNDNVQICPYCKTFTKNMNFKNKEKLKEIYVDKKASIDNKQLKYLEYRQGAIELKENYMTVYYNLFPFLHCRKGRISYTIFYNNMQSITYKASGWFRGVLDIDYKHFNKPLKIRYSLWWPWTSWRLGRKMNEIYDTIFDLIKYYNIESK